MGKFMIVIYAKPHAAPLLDMDGSIVFFDSHEEAMSLAKKHNACSRLGFEVFEMLEP